MNETYMIDGIKVYDPRVEKRIVSTNLALIMANCLEEGFILADIEINSNFWEKIKVLADFCDEDNNYV